MIAWVKNRLGQASTDGAVGENRCAVADSAQPMAARAPVEASFFDIKIAFCARPAFADSYQTHSILGSGVKFRVKPPG
ncbi:hypothetical protein [Polaromonas sp. DSR2-3-2]|uniref:hypothetical protein n=1 Tax=unclassified Polaromonas TaxID=2638319 RepID=UPI003CFB8388